jgi:hypothetical protein
VSKPKKLEIYWYAVTYKKIVLWTFLGMLGLAVLSLPFTKDKLKTLAVTQLENLIAPKPENPANEANKSGVFTELKGTVKVKKGNYPYWITADYTTKLQTGDLIQTSAEAIAKIQFPDKTVYTVKPDSLLVVQENSENVKTQARKVSVRVTSGTVDLSTSRREVSSSRSEVLASSTTMNLGEETRATLKVDAPTGNYNIEMFRGNSVIKNNLSGQELSLNANESLSGNQRQMIKEKMLSPPDAISPESLHPIISRQGTNTRITFTWKPVPEATAYHIRISDSSAFIRILHEKTVRDTQYLALGLDEGTYYWSVKSIDDLHKKQSLDNDPPNKFTLIFQTGNESENANILLKIESVYRLGTYYQISGKTDPSARLMINDEDVITQIDGSFKHLTTPVPHRGKYVIRITAQDRNGNAKTIPYFVDMD